MDADNPISATAVPERPNAQSAAGAPILSAVLTPHRSLDRNGFLVVMLLFGAISFGAGVTFLVMGAWPVFGFFGLDVLLVWLAFRASFRSARIREEVVVTADEIVVRRFEPRKDVSVLHLNPAWVRVDTVVDPEDGMTRLTISSHGRTYLLGGFLDPESRASFAGALQAALHAAKSGPLPTASAPSSV